jgi:hypothetical protein
MENTPSARERETLRFCLKNNFLLAEKTPDQYIGENVAELRWLVFNGDGTDAFCLLFRKTSRHTAEFFEKGRRKATKFGLI